MKPDLQRALDFWIGVPLCLLLTLVRRPWGRRRVPPSPPANILFIELAEMGGLVVARPALVRARELFPQAQLFFLTFAPGGELLRLMEAMPAEHVFSIDPANPWTLARDTLRALRRMRRLGIDAVVNLEAFARFSSLVSYLSGAARRVGWHRFFVEGNYLGDLLTHRVIYNPHLHAGLGFISLVEALAQEPSRQEPLAKLPLDPGRLVPPRARLDPRDQAWARQRLAGALGDPRPQRRLVLLNPNASDLVAARRWPRGHFLALAQGLLQDPRVDLVFTGGRADQAGAQSLARELDSPRALSLAGETSLGQLLALYEQSHLLITNDSGPAHFACLADLPALVLFGPETPAIYGPLGQRVEVIHLGLACSPCVSVFDHKRSPCRDNRCLSQINPQMVLERARALLDKSWE